MKVERSAGRTSHHKEALRERSDDSYRDDAKRPDPARCPKCGAVWLKGRWTWGRAPEGAATHKCPACRRTEDDFPAGYLTLSGDFLPLHRTEILNLVMARATRAREEHPLQRVMSVENVAGGMMVKTTDTHLARAIAQAVQEAFKGELELAYGRDENLLRATWSRS
jgi:NMD protein affecting ribosome stability and mRNA decay